MNDTMEKKVEQSKSSGSKENRKQAKVVAGLSVAFLISILIWYVQIGELNGGWMIGMLVVAGLTALLSFGYAYWLTKQSVLHEPDYRLLFFIGIAWVVVGFQTDMLPLLLVGGSFMLFGFHNRYRWKKKDSSKREQLKKAKNAIGLGLFFLLGGLILFLLS